MTQSKKKKRKKNDKKKKKGGRQRKETKRKKRKYTPKDTYEEDEDESECKDYENEDEDENENENLSQDTFFDNMSGESQNEFESEKEIEGELDLELESEIESLNEHEIEHESEHEIEDEIEHEGEKRGKKTFIDWNSMRLECIKRVEEENDMDFFPDFGKPSFVFTSTAIFNSKNMKAASNTNRYYLFNDVSTKVTAVLTKGYGGLLLLFCN